MVLECLNLHARNRLHVILGLLIVETGNFVFHKSGQFHVEGRVTFTDGFDDALEVVLIQLREFREAVVGEQIGEFLRVAAVVLIVHGDFLRAHQQSRFESSVTANDEPAALADRDRPAPTLLLDNRGQELDLMRAMPVRVFGIRLQGRRINESIMCAVNLHAARSVSKCAGLTGLRNLRRFAAMTHNQFAKTLVAWREQNDFTQQEAADQLGVSRRSLENWEQERAMPQGFGLSAMLAVIQTASPEKLTRRKRGK